MNSSSPVQSSSQGMDITNYVIIFVTISHYFTSLILHIWPQSITSKCCKAEFSDNRNVTIQDPVIKTST